MSKNVKKVLKVLVTLTVGVTVGVTATSIVYSSTAKSGLDDTIKKGKEGYNLYYSVAEIYEKQAKEYENIGKYDFAETKKGTADIMQGGGDTLKALVDKAAKANSKLFVNSNDIKNIVKLENAVEGMDKEYWQNTLEVEQKELEELKK